MIRDESEVAQIGRLSEAKRDNPVLLSLVANALAWTFYARDGRELGLDENGHPTLLDLTDPELAQIHDAAYRVLGHLDTYDQVEAQK